MLADLLAEQSRPRRDRRRASRTSSWALPTPSPGWTVADQIGHLMYFDGTAALAITDPDAFTATVTALLAAMAAVAGDDPTLEDARAMAPAELLEAWRANRLALADGVVDARRRRHGSSGTGRRWAPSRSSPPG